MVRRPFLAAALVAGLLSAVAVAVALPSIAQQAAAAAAPVRIMPLGDSITGSPGCWRSLLWNRLQSNGFTDVDFVGTLPPQGCGRAYDGENEGHGGALVTNVADQNQLVGWLAATTPDIVLMHFGTNDVWSNRPVSTILAAYSKLVDQMRASKPTMRILVAQIIPLNPSTCAECAQRVRDLNSAIPSWASSKFSAQSPITIVDQWTGFNTATDTYDGAHPNAAGDQKMSDKWYPALTAALTMTTPSRPPTASWSTSLPPSSPTGPPTSAPVGGCTATYRVAGQWQGGFQGEITVRNTGTAATRGWTVRFTFGAGQQVSQIWGGTLTQSGANVTVTNAAYNGAIGANGSVTFGFIGSWTGSNPVPTPTCTAT